MHMPLINNVEAHKLRTLLLKINFPIEFYFRNPTVAHQKLGLTSFIQVTNIISHDWTNLYALIYSNTKCKRWNQVERQKLLVFTVLIRI